MGGRAQPRSPFPPPSLSLSASFLWGGRGVGKLGLPSHTLSLSLFPFPFSEIGRWRWSVRDGDRDRMTGVGIYRLNFFFFYIDMYLSEQRGLAEKETDDMAWHGMAWHVGGACLQMMRWIDMEYILRYSPFSKAFHSFFFCFLPALPKKPNPLNPPPSPPSPASLSPAYSAPQQCAPTRGRCPARGPHPRARTRRRGTCARGRCRVRLLRNCWVF